MIHDFRPDLLPQIRELEMHARRDVLSRTLTGNWLSKLKGEGIEFAGYRAYQPSDDSSLIDWRASLRAQKILVKEHTQDRNLNVIVLLDASETMLYGSGEKLKAEYAAGVASSIAYAALRAGDAAGLAMFSEKLTRFVPPSTGLKHHTLITRVLKDPKNYGGKSNLKQALQEVMGAMDTPGLIVLVSDFLEPQEDWMKYLRVADLKFDFIGVMIRDKRDRRLPKNAGEYVLVDPSTGEKIIIDCAAYAEPYKEYVRQEEQSIRETFHRMNSDVAILEPEHDAIKKLMSFFYRRSKQAGGVS